jgi:hypothetical protein
VLAFLALCAAPACGDRSPSIPTRGTATASGETFDLADFSITIPEGWAPFDMSSADLSAEIRKRADPAQVAMLTPILRQVSSQGLVKFMAFEKQSIASGFANTVNVIVQADPSNTAMDAIVALNVEQLKALGAQGIRRERVTIGTNTFEAIRSVVPSLGSESRSMLLRCGQKVHTITFTAKAGQGDAFFRRAEALLNGYGCRAGR